MKGINFSKSFFFTRYHYKHTHHTDAGSGASRHFLGLLEKGRCRIVSEGRTIEAQAGQVFYIPMGLPYQSYWFSDDAVVFRSYGFDWFPENQSETYPLQVLPPEAGAILSPVPLCGYPDSQSLGALFTALGQLLPLMEQAKPGRARCVWADAVAYLQAHPDCPVAELAHHCGVSESALYTSFQRHGSTPNLTRQAILVEEAKRLLRSTDESIQQISDRLGFSSPSYFRKVFCRHTGQTPTQVRRAGTRV